MEIQYTSKLPAPDELWALYDRLGWNEFLQLNSSALHKAMEQSWYSIYAYHGNQLVATGRVVSDGVINAYLCGFGRRRSVSGSRHWDGDQPPIGGKVPKQSLAYPVFLRGCLGAVLSEDGICQVRDWNESEGNGARLEGSVAIRTPYEGRRGFNGTTRVGRAYLSDPQRCEDGGTARLRCGGFAGLLVS